MLCTLEQRDGKWYCINCSGRPLKGNYKRPCKTDDSQLPNVVYPNSAAWFTIRHNQIPSQNNILDLPSLLIKLERCRNANCDNLVNDVCQTRGASCKAREFWFTKLMLGDCDRWLDSRNPG